MDLLFDITEEEMPIFLAETNEQIQVLEEGLVVLEKSQQDADLVQSLFRAAHTLKGSAGMIGHKRMVELTHALENALDGVRKKTLAISTDLIDACLQMVDVLRVVSDEVSTGVSSGVEIAPLVARLARVTGGGPATSQEAAPPAATPAPAGPAAASPTASASPAALHIVAEINPESIASAARAFQIMLILQEMAEVLHMDPSQEQIETAAPVARFSAQIIPRAAPEKLCQALRAISEIDRLTVNGDEVDLCAAAVVKKSPPATESGGKLGEILVKSGVISQAQLSQALAVEDDGPALPLGQKLVKLGTITQEVLDEALSEQKQEKRTQPAPAENQPERARQKAAEKTVRTSVERLDTLMNLVGELITDRNRLFMIRNNLEARYRGEEQVDFLAEAIGHVGRITDQLQSEVMSIRMLPISNVFNKFPRLVRDLARNAKKQIDLVVRGEDTELDRSVIEEISDPLIHLLRNAVDHGIELPADRRAAGKPERGTVLLTARHEQGRIIITVEDDGRGIDIERVKAKAVEKGLQTAADVAAMSNEEAIDLIFLSGLSTAKVVSDVSGRGVGMDIVRNNIERLNGNIVVETWPGRGTQFQIVLPLTLAIVPSLLVRVARSTFAVPLVTVTETLRVRSQDIQTVNGRPVILLRNHVLPVIHLSGVFKLASRNGREKNVYEYIVVVRSGKSQLGLVVDTLVGEQEVVVKSLSATIGDVTGISSAAILGDGSVALIIEVQGLFKLASQHDHRAQTAAEEAL